MREITLRQSTSKLKDSTYPVVIIIYTVQPVRLCAHIDFSKSNLFG